MERKKLKPLTSTQLKFTCLGHTITSSKHMNKERHFTQHRGTSVYEHSIGVAYTSYFIASHLPFRFDEQALIRGALLHDYFLYDWHEKMIPINGMDLTIRVLPKKKLSRLSN